MSITDDLGIFNYPLDAEWVVEWGKTTFRQPSAYDILQVIAAKSYSRNNPKKIKSLIAHRVFNQFRVLIDDEVDEGKFLEQLAEFGIIRLTIYGTRPSDVLNEALDFYEAFLENPDG